MCRIVGVDDILLNIGCNETLASCVSVVGLRGDASCGFVFSLLLSCYLVGALLLLLLLVGALALHCEFNNVFRERWLDEHFEEDPFRIRP